MTRRRWKTRQIEALRTMGLQFWICSIRESVVIIAAVERRRETAREKAWIMPRQNDGTKHTRNLHMPPHIHSWKQRNGIIYYYICKKYGGERRVAIAIEDDFILALKKPALRAQF